MKVVALVTEDFRFFYGAVRALKERGQPFVSLGFNDPLPYNVGLVLTTEPERKRVHGRKVIASNDPEWAAKAALALLQGGPFKRLIVGVDPGPRPGIAILGDGKVLFADDLLSPEAVAPTIRDFLSLVRSDELLLRVGDGDPTNRDRIINALWEVAHNIEMVDERSTTRRTGHPDADAAVAIAQAHGPLLPAPPRVAPTEGEVRDIQRQSRIESQGAVTISASLARKVATGALSLGEAIERQRGKGRSEGDP